MLELVVSNSLTRVLMQNISTQEIMVKIKGLNIRLSGISCPTITVTVKEGIIQHRDISVGIMCTVHRLVSIRVSVDTEMMVIGLDIYVFWIARRVQ